MKGKSKEQKRITLMRVVFSGEAGMTEGQLQENLFQSGEYFEHLCVCIPEQDFSMVYNSLP
jgi:hypothetical protein